MFCWGDGWNLTSKWIQHPKIPYMGEGLAFFLHILGDIGRAYLISWTLSFFLWKCWVPVAFSAILAIFDTLVYKNYTFLTFWVIKYWNKATYTLKICNYKSCKDTNNWFMAFWKRKIFKIAQISPFSQEIALFYDYIFGYNKRIWCPIFTIQKVFFISAHTLSKKFKIRQIASFWNFPLTRLL